METKKVEVDLSSFHRLLHPKLVVLVTCINPLKDTTNIITLAWIMPISRHPPLLLLSMARKSYSHELIAGPKEFVVNIPTMDIVKETLFCGRRTGRIHDKFKETGLTPMPAKMIRPPIIEECVAHLECKLYQQILMGDHTVFVGEVLKAYVNEGFFPNSKFDLEKVKLIYHVGGDDFATLASKVVSLGLEKEEK
ncbi:MAG: flavin reductase family protein [Candidatus Bathyarchaeota archaeon]|nr:MAG: flavin reductase family protein [Candidatus Bathyarchaeota archaeon]